MQLKFEEQLHSYYLVHVVWVMASETRRATLRSRHLRSIRLPRSDSSEDKLLVSEEYIVVSAATAEACHDLIAQVAPTGARCTCHQLSKYAEITR